LPRVPALDRLVGGAHAKPWRAVALVAGALMVAAWLGWAIYVAFAQGMTEGIGVLIAWPALLSALLLVGLPFIGIYFLVRRLRDESAIDDESPAPSDESKAAAEAEEAQVTETG
jgi:hypothetical protein